jgi:hypothetical protein
MPVIPTLGKQRQKDYEFEASLDYSGVPCLKKIKSQNEGKQNKGTSEKINKAKSWHLFETTNKISTPPGRLIKEKSKEH